MLEFHSASVRMANPQRAMLEWEAALGASGTGCDLLIINASVGHDLAALSAQAQASCPGIRVVGASCAGVVGREGVSESMNDVAVMAIRGQDFVLSHVDGATSTVCAATTPTRRDSHWPKACSAAARR